MKRDDDLLPPWEVIRNTLFTEELEKEVAPGHSLYGIKTNAIAKRGDCDDALFALENHTSQLAVVHLTWKGRPEADTAWPAIKFYADWKEWREPV